MNGASLVRNAVVGGDRCAHALRTVLREALYILARCERRVREQQARGLCALTAAAVPADFDHVFHAVSSCIMLSVPEQQKTSLHPRKGTKARKISSSFNHPLLRTGIRGFDNGKAAVSTYCFGKKFGLQLRSDIRLRPTCTGLAPYPGSLRVRYSERTVSIIIFCG